MTRTSGDSGWVTLRGPKSWASSYLLMPALLPLLAAASVNLTLTFVRHLPLVWAIVIMVAVTGALVALVQLVIRLLYPRPSLNPSTSTLRAGRREARYSDLSSAQLLVSASRKHRILNLLLHGDNGLRALISIRDGRGRTLDPEASVLVQEMLQQSNIAMPTSSADPSGRFARYNFPDHLTKDDAIDLVANPPEMGEELPIPPRI